MELATTVEETDIGLCADGFDNFFLYEEGVSEMEDYTKILTKIGATNCAAIIRELLSWVKAEGSSVTALDVIESDKSRANDLWRRYNSASEREQPQELAKAFSPEPSKPKLPTTDREWYLYLGDEDKSRECRTDGCSRGAVKLSVFCRVHHYESVKKEECPWTD